MKECRESKRLQIYLDGWLDGAEAERLEEHLKSCERCQTALMEFEEISVSALEIVDHAPERDYWESFFNRVQNRVLSRDVSPYAENKKSSLRLKAASFSIGIMSIAAVFLLTFGYLTDSSSDREFIKTAPVENLIVSDEKSDAVSPSGDLSADLEEILETSFSDEGPETHVSVAEVDAEEPDVPIELVLAESPDHVDSADETPLSIERSDYRSAFRDPLRITPPSLSLSDDENFLTRLLVEYGGLSMEDYSVSPNVVAEGILSGYASGAGGTLTGNPDGSPLISRSSSLSDGFYPRWGYLGVPFDSTRTQGLRRYLIELELTRVK